MQISGIISKIKTPNLNGGLVFVLSVFVCNVAGASQYVPPGCKRAVTYTACVNPISMGADSPNCKETADFTSCLECEPCYDMYQSGSYPNNELGDWSNKLWGCSEIPFTEVNTRGSKFYEGRSCGGEMEYRCTGKLVDGYHVYQSRDTVSCNPPTTGTLYTCSGCSRCNTDTEIWENLSAHVGYQQLNKNIYSSAGTGSCTKTPQNQYRCGAGYYGNAVVSGASYSGCNKCPTVESTGLTVVENPFDYPTVTSLPGSTSVSQCHAQNCGNDCLIVMNDGTGNFYWTWDDATAGQGTCYYGN